MKLYKIKKSKIDNKGRGLYAAQNIKAGTKIIEKGIKNLKLSSKVNDIEIQ